MVLLASWWSWLLRTLGISDCSIQEMGDLCSTTRCLILLKLGFNLFLISFFSENLSDISSYSKYQMYEDWKILRSAWADSIYLPVVWYDAQSLCLTRLFLWLSESLIININFHSHTHLFLSVHHTFGWCECGWMLPDYLELLAFLFAAFGPLIGVLAAEIFC